MFTLHATKLFTSGLLEGLTYDFTMSFVDEWSAIQWAQFAEKGVEKPVCGSPYKVTAWRVTADAN